MVCCPVTRQELRLYRVDVVGVGEGRRPEDIRIDLESYIGVFLNICQVWVLGLGLDDLLTDQTEEIYTVAPAP